MTISECAAFRRDDSSNCSDHRGTLGSEWEGSDSKSVATARCCLFCRVLIAAVEDSRLGSAGRDNAGAEVDAIGNTIASMGGVSRSS